MRVANFIILYYLSQQFLKTVFRLHHHLHHGLPRGPRQVRGRGHRRPLPLHRGHHGHHPPADAAPAHARDPRHRGGRHQGLHAAGDGAAQVHHGARRRQRRGGGGHQGGQEGEEGREGGGGAGGGGGGEQGGAAEPAAEAVPALPPARGGGPHQDGAQAGQGRGEAQVLHWCGQEEVIHDVSSNERLFEAVK